MFDRQFLILVYGRKKTNNGKRKLSMVQNTGPFCARCKQWKDIGDLTVDHIIPRKMGLQGGQYQTPENRQLLCTECQYLKCALEQWFKRRIDSRKKRYLLFID